MWIIMSLAYRGLRLVKICRWSYQKSRSISGISKVITAYDTFKPDRFVDLDNQSYLLPGPERIRSSMLTKDPTKLTSDIKSPISVEVKTVYDVLNHGMKLSDDADCAGVLNKATGKYEWISYSEVIEYTQLLGSALIEHGLKPRENTYVGVFASNRLEFFLSLYACAGYSMILIPIYDSLGADNVTFIIEQAKLPFVIANNDKNAMNVLKSAKKLPFLKKLVTMDQPSTEVKSTAKSAGIELITFAELKILGREKKKPLVLPEPDDLFCIPYTSGTTGQPKGVMLTHTNILSCLSSLMYSYGPGGVYGGTIISYLPPAHIYEIMNQIASLFYGRRIAFIVPDVKTLFDDIRKLKPEIIPLVPRLVNAVHSKVVEQLKSSMWKWYLFQFAMSRKEKKIKKGIIGNNTIWDKLVFKKVQQAFGGNARMIITASAPISPEVVRFLRCASGCYVFEAYGQTEALATTMTLPHEIEGGSVGAPLPCNFIKLVDVPEMNYFAKNDEGEVCYKGPNVFQGYFNAPQLTKECIDADGWHHSGDIGRWLPNGSLKIIDRKKHIFKLSQGEYITPEKIENAYSQSRLLSQVYIDGLSDKDYVVAIIVPETIAFTAWAKKRGFKEPIEKLIINKDLRKEFLVRLHKFGQGMDLNSLEQARNVCFIQEPFSMENGLLSPTLKLKRNEARKYYAHLLQSMYEEGPLVETLKNS